MEVSDEELQIFLDEDGFEYTGQTPEVNSPEAASPPQESCRDVEVPDSPRQQQKREKKAAPANPAKMQRVMLLDKSKENVMSMITKEHNSDELCDIETFK